MRFHQLTNTAADHAKIEWVIDQASHDTNAIGFLPRSKYYELASRGRLIALADRGELIAWLAAGTLRNGRQKLYQIQTRRDCRREGFGTRIIETTFAGLFLDRGTLVLRCRDDLQANAFWLALGFTNVAKKRGGLRRGRLINIFERGRKIEATGTPLTRPAGCPRP